MPEIVIMVGLELSVVEVFIHVWLYHVDVEEIKKDEVWEVDKEE